MAEQILDPDTTPLNKVQGEPKEHHEARLGAALPVFDVHAYVEDFNQSIVSAYRRGVADAELVADIGLARSIIPPGTAATRDFSHLAPRIPDFVREACVGCMSCVSACPDTAILGVALPETDVDTAIGDFAAGTADPALAAERPAGTSPTPRNTPRCPRSRASRPPSSASSSIRSTARAVPSASRSATPSAMTRSG